MKKILFIILMALSHLPTYAQIEGHITGTVKNNRGEPLEGFTVLLKENDSFAAITDAKGTYHLHHLPLGSFTVLAMGMGYIQEERAIVLTPETADITLSFTLRQSSQSLQEVEVMGRKETSYKSEYSFIGTKPLPW